MTRIAEQFQRLMKEGRLFTALTPAQLALASQDRRLPLWYQQYAAAAVGTDWATAGGNSMMGYDAVCCYVIGVLAYHSVLVPLHYDLERESAIRGWLLWEGPSESERQELEDDNG